MTEEKRTKVHEYANQSRGYKTKGNTYKDRYVEIECPDCKHGRAYKDVWKTRIAYTCLKRDCRHKWYQQLTMEEIQLAQLTKVQVESSQDVESNT